MTRRSQSLAQRNILILMEWYDHRIRQGIGTYAREHGWHLTVDEGAQVPRGWEGDGVLTVFHARRDIVAFVRKLVIPVVDLGLYRPEIAMPRVIGDHERIGRMAADHFAERGFRNTAWFSTAFTHIHRLRLAGFRTGCAGYGLPAPQEWIWERACEDSPDDWRRMRHWLERRLRQAPKPLAVFAHNDYDASKVEDVCRACGLVVPEEVSVLGVDDNELICTNQPVPLSSIAHDLTRVGYEGAALLDRLLDGERPPKEPVLIPPTAVVLRQSTDLTAVRVPAVRAALRFLRENLGQSIGISEVAAAVGVSRTTLDRLFVQHLNRTVHEELQRTRMAAVKRLLLQTDLPVIDIARQAGFCHAQYLGNLFRRIEGLTPRSYRKRYALAK